jgi:hypothetical protein
MTEHELQRWLERHNAELVAADIDTALGRGPSLGSQRGQTWISFQSKRMQARVVLSTSGVCRFTASSRADGGERFESTEDFTSSAGLDAAMAVLVRHLT